MFWKSYQNILMSSTQYEKYEVLLPVSPEFTFVNIVQHNTTLSHSVSLDYESHCRFLEMLKVKVVKGFALGQDKQNLPMSHVG